MKRILKIIFGISLVIAMGIGAVFYFTAGMVETATAFFEAAKKQNIAAAHGHLSEDFRASTNESALHQFLSNSSLLEFKEANWNSRQITGSRGELEGVVTTETGGKVPIKLTFVKESEKWKIYSIQKPTAGLQVEPVLPGAPSKPEQVALIKQSIRNFAISVDHKSMEHFYGTVSQLWQEQTTIEELDESFRVAYDAGWDFTVLDRLEPIVEPVTSLGENGELILKGYFPTEPAQFHFEQKYIYEGIEWRLYSFSFNVKRPSHNGPLQ